MVQVSEICYPEKKHIFENVSLSRITIYDGLKIFQETYLTS
ncbi:hypothetical protein H311_01358 [Anncaliia algerae PRA109]|nr:hypothetical protein H311_01358 [Anncaliia algerae PRA109]